MVLLNLVRGVTNFEINSKVAVLDSVEIRDSVVTLDDTPQTCSDEFQVEKLP